VTNIIPAEDITYPQPITVKDTGEEVEDFIIAERGKKETVIIRGEKPKKYRFPYWGGDMNLNRYIQIITGSRLPVVAYDTGAVI
jgi:hypothetical protein